MVPQALLREYLKHAGLQETLRALDMELVRAVASYPGSTRSIPAVEDTWKPRKLEIPCCAEL